jgi:hypothetical protein
LMVFVGRNVSELRGGRRPHGIGRARQRGQPAVGPLIGVLGGQYAL